MDSFPGGYIMIIHPESSATGCQPNGPCVKSSRLSCAGIWKLYQKIEDCL